MKRKTFIFLMLSIFFLSLNAQVQSFNFTSSGNKFKLDEQTEVEGTITISPEVSTVSESGISSILPNASYNIEAGVEYTISGEFKILDCCENQIDSLNVTGLTSLVELWCHENNLKSLNVSGLTNLSELWLSDNQITSIDVSGLAMLKTFDCNKNKLKSLDLTNLSNLEELICFGNLFSVCGMDSVFSSLPERPANSSAKIVIGDINENSPVLATCRTDLANSKNWKVLRFANDYVTHQEIINSEPYGCPESEEFVGFYFVSSGETFKIALVSVISGTDAISVDPMVKNADGEDVSVILKGKVYKIIPNTSYKVGGKFKKLDVNENNLTELSFSGLTNLSHLWCTTNQLKSIDVSGLTNLTNFSCYENQLKSLDLSDLTVIKSVFCNSNNFSACGLDSLFTSLPARVQSDNATIVLARNEDTLNEPLKTCRSYIAKDKQWLLLHFKGNMANSVEIINSEPYGCPESTSEESFKFISSGTTFKLGNMTETTSEIKISPVVATAETSDISTIQKETDYIILPNTEYTVSGKFRELNISELGLTSLDISELSMLKRLDCSNNNLSSLDLSNNTSLLYVDSEKNNLSVFDISNLDDIVYLDCSTNNLIDIKMDDEIEEPGAFMGSEQSLNILMKKNSDGNYISINTYDVASNHQFVIDNAGSISFVDGYFKSTELSSDEKTFTTNIGWGEEMKLSGKLKFEYEQIVKYTITASVDGGNGSISPSDEVEVVSGESQEFKILPNPEYGIESVFVDDNNVTSLLNGNIYKFENVQANHIITVKFVHSSSISEQLLEQINIYPNPIFHELQISSPEIIKEVYVYDISGKLLIKENVNNTHARIETSEIGRGIYVLRVQTIGKVSNFKIIKN